MFINAGNGEIISDKRLIGIFDLETASVEPATREWLSAAEKAGRTRYTGTEIPLSVLLIDADFHRRAKNAEDTVLVLSQFTPKTVAKRGETAL